LVYAPLTFRPIASAVVVPPSHFRPEFQSASFNATVIGAQMLTGVTWHSRSVKELWLPTLWPLALPIPDLLDISVYFFYIHIDIYILLSSQLIRQLLGQLLGNCYDFFYHFFQFSSIFFSFYFSPTFGPLYNPFILWGVFVFSTNKFCSFWPKRCQAVFSPVLCSIV